MKLLFAVGSASDPAGREGLAEMTAAMVTEAGSVQMRTEEISRALFPLAGSFGAQVDKEMTTLTGVIHRDNLEKFARIALPQLLTPGWREDDFERIKDIQLNALVQDLCNDNEEELGKERLQANAFAETRYAHPSLGTQEGIAAITLDDVKAAYARLFTQANLTVGLIGDVPESFIKLLREKLAALPAGTETKAAAITGRRPDAIEVEIIKKETRATAISFGHPSRFCGTLVGTVLVRRAPRFERAALHAAA
jgi:zinc protease